VLEVSGGGLRLRLDPEHGGRIVSLTGLGREWLTGSSPAEPGATRFVHPGTGGWDEALPTIAPSDDLPDHGDVWNVPWSVASVGEDEVTTTVRSVSSGVVLERRIRATSDGLAMRYRASTGAARPRSFLWSAHPLFSAADGAHVVLPGVTEALQEYPRVDPHAPVPGATSSGPADDDVTPRAVKAFVASTALRSSSEKTGGSRRVQASIVLADDRALSMTWDPLEIPWLGIYADTGEFSQGPVLALEPTSTPSDAAAGASELWAVSAASPREWSIHLHCSGKA
jgi:galactose mutarotase-like enzyme